MNMVKIKYVFLFSLFLFPTKAYLMNPNDIKTILTNLHADLDYKSLIKQLPKNVVPAYDGMTLLL